MNEEIEKFLQGKLVIVFSNNRLIRVKEVQTFFKNMKAIDNRGCFNWEKEKDCCSGFEPNIYAVKIEKIHEDGFSTFMVFTSQKNLEKFSKAKTIPFISIAEEFLKALTNKSS